MISLLGPPPPTLLARGQLTKKFFSDDGKSVSWIRWRILADCSTPSR